MSVLVRKHLIAACPVLGAHIGRVGPLPWPKPVYTDLYQALIRAVAHQQLHGRAAETILGRLAALNDGALPTPAELLDLPDEAIRGCGFSGSKMAALRDIAARTADGTVPTAAQAKKLSDAELIERLVTIRGVGQWTVEMLLIFTLKRPDVFPVDDFGVREGYRVLYGLEAQPKAKVFSEMGKVYAPYRSMASLYLWRAADLAKPTKAVKASVSAPAEGVISEKAGAARGRVKSS
jgi:DNA-3-methyladenine glycosylase II